MPWLIVSIQPSAFALHNSEFIVRSCRIDRFFAQEFPRLGELFLDAQQLIVLGDAVGATDGRNLQTELSLDLSPRNAWLSGVTSDGGV